MRPAQKSNRSRGRGNRKSGGGGNNINRVYDSAGPEGKVRGTPQQIIDKYLTLARDAQTSGDRVTAENFLQHAEHYQRILIQAAATQESARVSQEAPEGQHRDAAEDAGSAPAPASDEETQPKPQPQAVAPTAEDNEDIGGMTTIDSGAEQSSLLVEGGEQPKPAAKPNGDGRRRRKKAPEPVEAPAEAADETPAAQADG